MALPQKSRSFVIKVAKLCVEPYKGASPGDPLRRAFGLLKLQQFALHLLQIREYRLTHTPFRLVHATQR